jgi:hypothetical protein
MPAGGRMPRFIFIKELFLTIIAYSRLSLRSRTYKSFFSASALPEAKGRVRVT